MKTKAAVLYQPGQPLSIEELAIPELCPGQLLVEVAFSGLCHSQLLEVNGKRGPDRFLPHTLGHEGSGTVVQIGPGVTKVSPGDRVVLSWIKGSGADVPSTTYQSSRVTVNSGALSTFMSHTVTCENRVTPIPDAMPLREAALLGCAIPTGAGIVLNTAKVQPNSSVAVFGVGGIGLSAVLAADFAGATTIIAVDVFDHKLEQARRVGATHLVNTRRDETLAKLREITGGFGVDYAIEAAGRRETMETAFRAVRDGGGLCVLAGNLPSGQVIEIDPFDLIKGKRIVGTWGGETNPDRDIPLYVDLYLAGRLKLDSLITHQYHLEAINSALEDLEDGNVGRALISMDGKAK
ncbi:MAG: zinc-binding dehydrogenase [Chloroflexi bacterium]|nr:zinc-binding dehydrogenase [Chloroflexota bacterium]